MTRTKHRELEDEVHTLRDEVRAIGEKQDGIQSQLENVQGRLEKVEALDTKVDRMETLLLKNDQAQSDILDYLKRMEGKISRPPTPDPETPVADYVVREQEIIMKQHAIAKEIQERDQALAALQLQSTTSDHAVLRCEQHTPVAHTQQLAVTVTAEKPSTVLYTSERAAQFMKNIVKGPKMDFPCFTGDNPLGWIRQVTKYFELSQVPDECKVDLAQTYITGRADNWLRSTKILQDGMTWEQFCRLICDRFAQASIYELLEKLHSLRQYSMTVSDYTDKFEELMAIVREEHPYLQEHYYIVTFVNGLRPDIRCNLRPQRPKTLSTAYWMARDYESGLQATARAQKQTSYLTCRQPQRLLGAPPPEKPAYVPPARKPGVCWRPTAVRRRRHQRGAGWLDNTA